MTGRDARSGSAVPVRTLLVVAMTAAVLVVTAPPVGDAAPRSVGRAHPAPDVLPPEAGAPDLVQIRRISRSRVRTHVVPVRASGDLELVRLPTVPRTPGRRVTYSLEIERGLPFDAREVARTVATVLADRRGWRSAAHVRFVPVAEASVKAGAAVDIRITMASPTLADRLCAPLETRGSFSCWQRGRAVLNARRWQNGARTYAGNLTAYRTYVINHEIGHGLGRGHEQCPRRGRRAPVMVQQTKTLDGCNPWPWPTRRDL